MLKAMIVAMPCQKYAVPVTDCYKFMGDRKTACEICVKEAAKVPVRIKQASNLNLSGNSLLMPVKQALNS